MGLSPETVAKLTNLVKTKRPDLMLLTDDVYGTFVPEFRSLLGELPHNTIGVYSYSKYFGCTGWRLGVIAIHEDNLYDRMIAKLPDADLHALDKRYQDACREIVQRRVHALIEGLGLELSPNALYDAYYGLIDFEFWARKNIGEEAVEYLKKNVHPLDLAFRLAADHGIVLLNGGGFDAPDWSLRVSLANLADDVYDDIGRGVRAIARGYRDAYEASKKAPKA